MEARVAQLARRSAGAVTTPCRIAAATPQPAATVRRPAAGSPKHPAPHRVNVDCQHGFSQGAPIQVVHASGAVSHQASTRPLAEQLVRLSLVVPEFVSAPGQQLMVCGNVPELGSWDATKACQLTWYQGHRWQANVDLPRRACQSLEFKIVLIDSSHQPAEVIWEEGPNRDLKAAHAELDGHVLVSCVWNSPAETEVEFLSDLSSPALSTLEDAAFMAEGVDQQSPLLSGSSGAPDAVLEQARSLIETLKQVASVVGTPAAVAAAGLGLGSIDEPCASEGGQQQVQLGSASAVAQRAVANVLAQAEALMDSVAAGPKASKPAAAALADSPLATFDEDAQAGLPTGGAPGAGLDPAMQEMASSILSQAQQLMNVVAAAGGGTGREPEAAAEASPAAAIEDIVLPFGTPSFSASVSDITGNMMAHARALLNSVRPNAAVVAPAPEAAAPPPPVAPSEDAPDESMRVSVLSTMDGDMADAYSVGAVSELIQEQRPPSPKPQQQPQQQAPPPPQHQEQPEGEQIDLLASIDIAAEMAEAALPPPPPPPASEHSNGDGNGNGTAKAASGAATADQLVSETLAQLAQLEASLGVNKTKGQ